MTGRSGKPRKTATSGIVLWGLYGAFATFALASKLDEATFQFSGPLGAVKAFVWLALLAFLAYSIYCTTQENFYRTLRTFAGLYWGRQIGADLYLGLFVSLLIIYLHEGALVMLVWLLPTLIYANLTILLYVALNFDSIAIRLLGT